MLINLEDKFKGVTPQGNCDKGIRNFVRSHFEQITKVRAKGYSSVTSRLKPEACKSLD